MRIAAAVLGAAVLGTGAWALDVTRPGEVGGLTTQRLGADDVQLDWSPVLLDATGHAEAVDHYTVYRGTTPDFVPDRVGGTNRIGSPATPSFTDPDAALSGDSFYYLVGAVYAAGNESNAAGSAITAPPVLSGFWTDTSIEVSWTPAAPGTEVAGYRVYYGRASGQYEFAADVGLATTHSLTGLQLLVNWYVAVTAVDSQGNESTFSNEHIDAVRGVVRVTAHNAEELCWGAADCIPADPAKVLRNDGFQLMVPVHFPEGDWVSVQMSFTMDSRLCTPPAQGTVSKCGTGNPCVSPPCNGGYNPCGDPWDRTAQVFLVLDDCIAAGGSCITADNLELMRAVTPFGTDARPPDGTGVIRPRTLALDVTPYAPLLAGERYVGVEIVHFVQKGHWVTVQFTFSERPADTSPKPPADGIQVVGFGSAPLPVREVTIPLSATDVKMRLFTTGHGGGTYCDGGANNGNPCSGAPNCPGGVCNPCDEFCHRENQIRVDGAPAWSAVPWRTDCSPGPACSTWNACGFPSCTFPRAGWCPGYVACHHNAPCDNDLDFTADLPPGGTYDVDYLVTPHNGSWPVSLVLFWYE